MVRLVFTGWEKNENKKAENRTRTKTNHMLNLISFARPGSLISFPLFCRESVKGGGAGGFCGPHAFLKGSLRTTFQPVEYQHDFKEQGVAQSTRLRPMWPWFKSWRRCHMWVEFVVSSLPFLRVLWFSPLHKNQNVQLQFDLERTDMFQEFLRTLKCSMGKQITNYRSTKVLILKGM